MERSEQDWAAFLLAVSAHRRYPFRDRISLWEERLRVNQAEIDLFASIGSIDESPIQDVVQDPSIPAYLADSPPLRSSSSPPVSDIFDLSATDLATAVRTGRVSPIDIAETCLARAEEQRHLNAFITLDAARIRAEARSLAQRQENGETLGPLAGVPVSVKDIMLVAGYPFTAGTKAVDGAIAGRDAHCIAMLRKADALIFGTANTHELGYGATGVNPHFGRMVNPASAAHILGGSSGGSVASVAARIVWGSVATDTGGSARIPACCGGVVALKPTHGAISRDGVMYVAWSLDNVAPVARTVEDAALLYEVMAGVPVGSSLRDDDSFGVLLPDNYFFEGVDTEIASHVREVVAQLARDGCAVVERRIDDIEMAPAAHLYTVLPEAAESHWPLLLDRPDELGADVRVRLEVGQFFLAVDYLKAQRLRARLRASMLEALEGVDVVIVPSLAQSAPSAEPGPSSISRAGQFSREQGRLTTPFSLAGMPAVTIPCGVDQEGCPIGLQIAGRPGADHRVLRAARRCEAVIKALQPRWQRAAPRTSSGNTAARP